jgi:hypothetical protein
MYFTDAWSVGFLQIFSFVEEEPSHLFLFSPFGSPADVCFSSIIGGISGETSGNCIVDIAGGFSCVNACGMPTQSDELVKP